MAKKHKTVRTSVTINSIDYEELQRRAEKNKVTVAWMVRDAVEKYLSTKPRTVSNDEQITKQIHARRAR